MKKSKSFFYNKTRIFLYSPLVIIFVLIPIIFPAPVYADVPSILNVEPWISGTDTILNITVRHSAPTSSHYIDLIQVDIDGTVNDINLDSQSTNPFIEQYIMGELSGEPSVRVRAHCNLHGWASWSSPQIIPEFSLIYLFIVLIVVSIAIIVLKSKIKIETNVCNYSKHQ